MSRIHDEGEILASEHVGEGTRVTARVNADLAAGFTAYRS